jgi:hypothetical protein
MGRSTQSPSCLRCRSTSASTCSCVDGLIAIELQAAAFPNDIAELHRAINGDDGKVLEINGNHRLSAMKTPEAKSIGAIVVPEATATYQILAMNTEKAHNLRGKSLEVIRMDRELERLSDATDETYAWSSRSRSSLRWDSAMKNEPDSVVGPIILSDPFNPWLPHLALHLMPPLEYLFEIKSERAVGSHSRGGHHESCRQQMYPLPRRCSAGS